MDLVFDARNPDEFFAYLVFVIAQNGWSFEAACSCAALILTLRNPAVATVVDVFGITPERYWSRIVEYIEPLADIFKATGLSNCNIDCVSVDGSRFECKWVSRQ